MGIYDSQAIDNFGFNQELDQAFGEAKEVTSDEEKAIKKVKASKGGAKAIKSLKEHGWSDSDIEYYLLEAAKKSKKKKEDSKDDDDDIDLDDIEDSDDSPDDTKDDDKDDKKSKKKNKDDDDSDDTDDSKDDDKDDKKSKKKDKDDDDKDDKKSKKKKSKKEEKEMEESNVISSEYNSYNPLKALQEEFDSVFKIHKKMIELPKPKGFIEATRLKIKEGFKYPYQSPEFSKVVMEHFDLRDNNTRVIMATVDEDDQSIVLQSLTDKLYDIIVSKSAEIDYGEIPKTKGDIDQLSNIDKIEDCLNTIREILIGYKQETDPVDEVAMCISNIRDRTSEFKKCYTAGIGFGVFTYQTIVLAVIASTSLLISGSIEFIKNPSSETYQISLDKAGYAKSKNSLLLTNLKEFNKICKDKSFDKALNASIEASAKHFLGTSTLVTLSIAAAVSVILFNLLPILRELTYFFFYTRTRISDWFNVQADLLDISAENIENGDSSTIDKPKEVIKRQRAIADRFRKVADFVMVDARETEIRANRELVNDKKKLKADDVMDTIPDSTASALF